jgi:hypothetical protein
MFSTERLRQEFLNYRQNFSGQESAYIETALQAFDHVQLPYQQLVSRFNDLNANDYIALNQREVRDLSVPLMLKLMLDVYINASNVEDEKTLLSEISFILSQVYTNPLHSLNNQTINELGSKILHWLNHYTPNNLSDDAEKQQLCQANFLVITCLRFKLQSLTWVEQGIFLINPETIGNLSRIESIINEKNQPSLMHDLTQNPSSHAYFQQFQSLNQDTESALTEISNICSAFKTKLDSITKAQSELSDIQELLAAIHTNQALTCPLYFHELMKKHPTLCESLYAHISTEQQEELKDYCQKTQENSYSNYVKNFASIIFSWSNVIYRNIAPQVVQDTLNYYLETNDSKAKSLLKEYGEQAIKKIQLTFNEESIQEFSRLNASEIEQLRTLNQTTLELSSKYQRIYQHAQQWKQTSLDISVYIQHKDSFFEHVIDFIKQFLTLFSKPSLAEKINLLREQQREIDSVVQLFKQEINGHSVLSTLQPTEILTAHKTHYQHLQSQVSLFRTSLPYLECQPNNYSRS